MKILISTPFYPPDLGGISHHIFNLVNRLSRKHEIIIVKNERKDKETKILGKEENNIRVIKLPSINLPPYPYPTLSSVRIPVITRNLKKIIKNENIDIIHSHGHHYPLTWLTTFYAKKNTVPTVLTMHGTYALDPFSVGGRTLLEEIFNEIIFKRVLQKSDSIIGLTKNDIIYAKRYGLKTSKYYLLPNGVNVNRYTKNLHRKMDFRAKYGLPQDKWIVLFRGRFTHVKSFLETIYAAKSIMKCRKDIFFLFIGGGPLKSIGKNILGEMKNFKIIDWTPIEYIHELYIASDIYLLPSKWEAFPITLLESMAARLHVISTQVSGLQEILKDYPLKTFLSDPKPEELIKNIYDIVKKDVNQSTYYEEIKSYIQQFSWENIISELEQIYIKTRENANHLK